MLIIFRHGIPFVAVHDSYWTYGPYVDHMNKVYSSPLSLSLSHTHTYCTPNFSISTLSFLQHFLHYYN